MQKDIGRWFTSSHILGADHLFEMGSKSAHPQDGGDDFVVGAGGQGHPSFSCQVRHQGRDGLKDGLSGFEQGHEAALFPGHQLVEGLGRCVAGDEVQPQRLVRTAVIIGEMEAVG